jgi:1-acyl-sn-glycerol-3-phosphate acyltransferase
VRVRVGRPLDFSRYEGLAGDRFAERSITDEIMYALMELSGQEYVDIYAAKAKDDLAAQGQDVGGWQSTARMPETKAG